MNDLTLVEQPAVSDQPTDEAMAKAVFVLMVCGFTPSPTR